MDNVLITRLRKSIEFPKGDVWVVSPVFLEFLKDLESRQTEKWKLHHNSKINPYGKPIFDNVYKYWRAKKDIEGYHRRFLHNNKWFAFLPDVKCNCRLCSSITKVKTRTDNMADNVLSWLDLNADEVIKERAINHIRRYINSIARDQLGE